MTVSTPVPVLPLGVDDLDQIMALEQAGFDDHDRWSRSSWQSQLAEPSLPVLGYRTDRLLGVITLRLTPDTADLDRIVVDPLGRRRGIGRALLHAGLDLAGRQGVREMILEVWTGNEPAIALYRSLGFTEIHRRPGYYGPGRDAMIMKRGVDHD